MSKLKVLFDLKKEYYFNSLYPLYREMVKDEQFDIFFRIGKDHKRFLWVFLINEKNRISEWMKKKGYRLTDKTSGFDLVVCGDALKNPEKYGNCLRIHLDHGVGIKTLRIRNIVKQKGYRYHVFLEGQYWFDFIKNLNWHDKADFYTTGIPKLDPFFWGGYYNRNAIIDKIGLDKNKKTVLYAPSYKPSCIEYIKDRIADLIPEYNLIIKLHPYSWGGKYASHSQHRYYEKLAKENPSVFLIGKEDYDIYPYMYAADTIISDTSSVINEFLALGRHGIIYELPYNELKHSDGMPVLSIDPKEWLLGAFPHMQSPDDLLTCVDQALNPTPEMRAKLEEYRNYFFTGLDGRSGERVMTKIYELLSRS